MCHSHGCSGKVGMSPLGKVEMSPFVPIEVNLEKLTHGGLDSNNKSSDKKIEEIKNLVSAHYYDFGPKFAEEKLQEKHGIDVSKETLKQLMIGWGLWKARREKQAKAHHLNFN
jgi:hypothetical protein